MQQQRQDNRVNPEFASIEKDANILRDAGYSLYQNPDTENTQALDYPEVNFSGPSFIPSIPMPTNEKVEKAKVNGLVAKVRAKKPKSITEEVATSLSAGASINSSIGGNTEYINKRDVPLMEQYDELNDGTLIPKYERFTHGINNEEKLAKQMTTGQKWGRGFKKLAVKSALYTAGGVTQSVASIAHAIQKGSIDALFDNETTRWFQDQETRLDHNLAHYYTEEEKNANFFESLGSANFWANDVFGGMAYTIGAMGTEAIMAGLTGGGSMVASGARMAMRQAVKKGAIYSGKAAVAANKKALKDLSRSIARKQNWRGAVNTARSMWTGAGYESAVEALQAKKENELNYIERYKAYNGGRMPSYKELKDFNDANVNASNSVFGANLAIVGLSNMVMFGKYMGVGNRLTDGLENITDRMLGLGVKREGRKVVMSPLKGWRKVAGRTAYALEKPFTEGVFEEGLQGVVSGASGKYLESKVDGESVKDTVSYIDALKEGFKDTYGTKEGLKEVGIGALVGTLMGGVRPGGRVGFTYDVKSMFGGEYIRKAERLQKLVEKYGSADANLSTSALNTLKRMSAFNSQIASESEVASFTDFDDSVFAKLNAEDDLGLLNSTVDDFDALVDSLSEEQIESTEGTFLGDIDSYKKSLKDKYRESVSDYKVASGFAKRLTSDTRLEPYKDIISLNAFRGIRAKRNMRDLSRMIGDAVSNPSIGRSLDIFSSLSEERKALVSEMDTLQKEIKSLEKETIRLSSSVAKTTKVNEEGREIETERDRHLKLIEEMDAKTTRIAEIDKRFSSMSNNSFSLSDISILGEETGLNPTTQEYVDAYNSLMAFEEYISSKESESDPNMPIIRDLVKSYRANMVNLKGYEIFMKNASNPAFLAGESKSWFSAAKRKVMEASELNMSEEEFDFMLNNDAFSDESKGLYANDAAIIKAMEDGRINSSDAFTYLALNHAIYDYKNGSVNSEVISDSIYNDFMNNDSDARPLDRYGVVKDIVDKLSYSGEEFLTPRQREIYHKYKDQIDPLVPAKNENPRSAIRSLLDRTKKLFGIKDDSLLKRNNDIIDEVLDQNAPKEESERAEYYAKYRGMIDRLKTLMRNEEEGKATPEERDEHMKIIEELDEFGITPLVMQNFYIEYKPSANIVSEFNDVNSIVSDQTSESDTVSSKNMVQNPDVIMTHKDKMGMNVISGLDMASFVGRFLDGYSKEEKGGKIAIDTPVGKIVFIKEKRGGRFLMSDASANVLFRTTGILVAPLGNIETSKWHGVYMRDDAGVYSPLYTNTKYIGESIDRDAVSEAKKGDEVMLSVDLTESELKNGYNEVLLGELKSKAKAHIESPTSEKAEKAYEKALDNFVNNAVIHVRDTSGRLISVVKSGKSDIRDLVLRSIVKEERENGSLVGVTVEGDGEIVAHNRKYKISQKLPGRPKFNIIETDGNTSIENKPITAQQSKRIVDVGYISGGKIVLKQLGSATEKSNKIGVNTFPFCTSTLRGSAGKQDIIPVVVIEHNGSKYAYPVSLAPSRVNAIAQNVINSIDASLQAEGVMDLSSIQQINTNLLRLRLGEEYQIPIGNATEGEVRDALARARDKLAEMADHADPMGWINPSDSRTPSEIASDDILINLDMDNPFYSPKLRIDFGNKKSEPKEVSGGVVSVGKEVPDVQENVDVEPSVEEQDNTINQAESIETDINTMAVSKLIDNAFSQEIANDVVEGLKERDKGFVSDSNEVKEGSSVSDTVANEVSDNIETPVKNIIKRMNTASGLADIAANVGINVNDIQEAINKFNERFPSAESIQKAYKSFGRESPNGPYYICNIISSRLNERVKNADRSYRMAVRKQEKEMLEKMKKNKC